jgi:hypothetical protein
MLLQSMQLLARRRFIRRQCWPPSIAQRRADDQIGDDLRPALLALLLQKR